MEQQSRTRILQTYGLWAVDMLCILTGYLVATAIRFAGNNDWGNKTQHYLVLVLFLLTGTIVSFFVDWNRDFLIRGSFRELMAVARFETVLIPVGLSLVFFFRWAAPLSRSVVLNFFWISFVLMLTAHILLKKAFHHILSTEQLVSRVFVIAQKKQMNETLIRLLDPQNVSYRVVGIAYIDPEEESGEAGTGQEDEATQEMVNGIPVFSGARDLTRKLTSLSFDEVLINTPDLSQKSMAPIIMGFEEMGVVCHYCLELPDLGEATNRVGNFSDYTVVTYTRFRSSYKRMMIKRLLDIAGGMAGLLLTGVITLFLAPAIKLDSPGPVFFSQIRVGKNGRRFRIYKFRSMYKDAEERKKKLEEQNEMKGLMFKMENDPRITGVGHFIRRTSLDEFPQFLNVLKGDMSLVGTRPPTEEEFVQYNEHYRRRISMTPGLTGLWQISGRSDIQDFDEVVKLDLQYIDNWNLSLDLKILLQTILVVFGGRGAK